MTHIINEKRNTNPTGKSANLDLALVSM